MPDYFIRGKEESDGHGIDRFAIIVEGEKVAHREEYSESEFVGYEIDPNTDLTPNDVEMLYEASQEGNLKSETLETDHAEEWGAPELD